MTYEWNQAFESYPPGSYLGSTMGEGLRRIKAAFYERFIVEHDITESAAPTVLHKLGECSIIDVHGVDDTPLSEYVEGGLQYKSPHLYWDDGSALQIGIPGDHGNYTSLSDDDHTQYVKISGESLSTTMSVASVTGLSTTGANYASTYSDRIMSISGHLATDGNGLSYHQVAYNKTEIDGLSDKTTFAFSGSKWSTSNVDMGNIDSDIAINRPEPLTVPFLTNISGTGRAYFLTSMADGGALWNSYRIYHSWQDNFIGTATIKVINT